MTSLSSSLTLPKLGNTSPSSLIKTAVANQNVIADNQDKYWAEVFKLDPSDATFNQYQDYLQQRVTSLQSSGTVADASKAFTLQNNLIDATNKNVSFDIKSESIQILLGNASDSDKLDYLTNNAYPRIKATGDMDGAQNIEYQAYQLNQKIQYDAQTAATAQDTLNKANETAMNNGYTDAISQIQHQLDYTLAQVKSGNTDEVSTSIKNLNTTLDSTSKALTGKGLPKGQGATMGGLVQAAFNAEYAYDQAASSALRVSNPEDADKFATYDANKNIVGGAAADITNGTQTVSVPGIGDITAREATQWANNPGLFGTKTGVDGTVSYFRNQVTGFQYVNGMLTPQTDQASAQALKSSTGAVGGNLPLVGKDLSQSFSSATNEKNQLEKLGFTVNKVNSDGTISVSFTSKTDKWTQAKGGNPDLASTSNLGGGNEATLIPQANGSFQFAKGNKLLNVAVDYRGLGAIFESKSTGGTIALAGQYGFNQSLNTLISNATIQQLQAKVAAESQAAASVRNQAAQVTSQLASAGTTATGQPAVHVTSPTGPVAPTQTPGYVNPASIKPGTSLTAAEQAQARNAINSLLGTGNQGLIQNTITAIQKSAGYGNPYDAFKLSLLPSGASATSGADKGTQFTSQLVSGALK